MNKIFKIFLIGLIGLMVFIPAVSSQQQTSDSAILVLTGVVGPYVSITLTPTSAATNLLLNITQSTPVVVATVIETSNTGFELDVVSQNGFEFSNPNSGNQSVPYTLWYNGNPFSENSIVSSGSSANNIEKTVGITYNAASTDVPEGNYTDVLTFTINAN